MTGLIGRYFKDHEVAEILRHKEDIQDYLVDKYNAEKQRIESERQRRLKQALEKEKGQKKTEDMDQEDKEDETKDAEEEEVKVVAVETTEANEEDEDDNMFLDDDEDDDEEMQEGVEGMKEKREEMLKKLQKRMGGKDNYRKKDIKVEFTDEGYINTFGNRVKRIEFVGFDKIWERLYNMNRIIDVSLSDQKIAHFGKLGQLAGICPNLRNLALEKNLISSWDQIIILGTELRNLESLAISYNMLSLENDDKINLSCLKSLNSGNQVLNCELKPSEIYPKLKHLILISMGLNFKTLSKVMPYFQGIDELVICNNYCNDFENINLEQFQNISKINLEDNKIDTAKGHKLEILSQLKNLERLSLLSNMVSEIPCIEKFTKLEQVNISRNNFQDGKIFGELCKVPNLTHLRFKYNPVSYRYNKNHSRQWAISEIPSLTHYNGLKVGRSERRDSEYYIMRHAFHEYFNTFQKTQFTYKYTEFEKWATEIYPIALTLVDKYENPYPEVDFDKLAEQGMGKLPGQRVLHTVNYVHINFITAVGPFLGKPPFRKRYPITTDFLYIRNFICQYFKLKNKGSVVLKFRNDPRGVYEEVDDLTKGLDFYGIKDGSYVLVEGEE